MDGKTKYPAYGESAIRVRAVPQAAIPNLQFPQPSPDEIGLILNLTAEPRIQLQQVLGVKLDKCLDDCKQDLSMSMVVVAIPDQTQEEREGNGDHQGTQRNRLLEDACPDGKLGFDRQHPQSQG